ncbi:hypothetical protein RF55_8459 [Lasius niger]|uniref:CCHC-type domain-containing protein n=1 Tax=Lasius niger TaxID=67767 RepID=A0A0J7KN39_LASNI|nr:hypothetical protein RF55_8459 [Lasius niger]
MERIRLEAATLEDLRQEALRYQLPVSASSDRESLIEAILDKLEQDNPLEEMLPPPQRSRTQSERSPASGKLVKLAKQWYEMQNGGVLESWAALKLALTQMFDRRVSFTASMQKIEARKWSPSKESFDQYSIDKLALIHRLNLPTADTINLIIGGIPQHSLRATALTLPTTSLDQFLEAMRRITAGLGDFDKKSPNQNNKNNRSKDSNSKDNKGQRDGKATETTCNYCKKRGHWKADCQLLKKKEKASPTTSSPASAKASTSSTQPTAAAVAESESSESAKFRITSPLIEIVNFNNNSCRLNALMDTGSPVSFISQNNLNKLLVTVPSLEPVERRFNALPKTPIDVLGKLNKQTFVTRMLQRNQL